MPEENKEFPLKVEDKRPLYDQVMESVNTIFTEEIVGLTGDAREYGCSLVPYVPPNGAETVSVERWESRIDENGEEYWDEEDYHTTERRLSYYLVKDTLGRDIAVLTINPGTMMDSDPYIEQTQYVGPPEEQNRWNEVLEKIRRNIY